MQDGPQIVGTLDGLSYQGIIQLEAYGGEAVFYAGLSS